VTITATSEGRSGTANITVTGGGAGGSLIFSEGFNDANLAARGWYDATGSVTFSSTEQYEGAQCAMAHWNAGASGNPWTIRYALPNTTEELYVRYRIKYSANWIGNGLTYGPHWVNVFSDTDHALFGGYLGGADAYFNWYIEDNYQSGIRPRMVVQDSRRIYNRNGYPHVAGVTQAWDDPGGEDVSIGGANGNRDGTGELMSYADAQATKGYVNAKTWKVASAPYSPDGQWHLVEAYMKINSRPGSVGAYDGVTWLKVDGVTVISQSGLYLRSGLSPVGGFKQLKISPYFDVNSPVSQTVYIDNLEIYGGIP
jgi:hypothetical protein